jgi:hypothetical protein
VIAATSRGQSAKNPDGKLKQFVPQDGSFSVSFPGVPVFSRNVTPPVTHLSYAPNRGPSGTFYLVEVTENDAFAGQSLSQIVSTMYGGPLGAPKIDSAIRVGGINGRWARREGEFRPGAGKVVEISRIFALGKRVFRASASSAPGHQLSPNAEEFLWSFNACKTPCRVRPEAQPLPPTTLVEIARRVGNDDELQTQGYLPPSMRRVLGVTLARTKVGPMHDRLGMSQFWATRDASEAEGHECYRAADSTLVGFVDDGEARSGDSLWDGFWVRRITAHDTIAPRCARAKGDPVATTPGGLRLGLTRAEVKTLLGRARREDDTSAVYSWQIEEPVPKTDPHWKAMNAERKECYDDKDPFLDVRGAIVLLFSGDKLRSFAIWRSDVSFC